MTRDKAITDLFNAITPGKALVEQGTAIGGILDTYASHHCSELQKRIEELTIENDRLRKILQHKRMTDK